MLCSSGNCKITPKHSTAAKDHRLVRTTFLTSREMDFLSERELVNQTGHNKDQWPLVIIKELPDNSLDACEEADVPPVLHVTVDHTGIGVRDNGPGLPESTLKAALDFTIRVSSREAYVSPTRGAQGNALKTLFPMARVLDPEHGLLVVTAHGKRHAIHCGPDPITQRAVVHDDVSDLPKSKNLDPRGDGENHGFSGTDVRLEWSPVPYGKPLERFTSSGDRWLAGSIYSLVEGFALFNPHATITLDYFGTRTVWEATDPAWRKWRPHQPTSIHWYEVRHFERLLGAHLNHQLDTGTDRLVSDVLAEFDGFAGSPKRTKVLTEAGLKRARLSDLVKDGRLDTDRVACLHAAMRRHTKPVTPARLGFLGEDHLRQRLLDMGIVPESFRYSRKVGGGKSKKSAAGGGAETMVSDMPFVLESAFGYRGEKCQDERRIYTGVNWSAAALKNPFKEFGATGEGLETALAEQRATRNEPIVFVLHLAQPRVQFSDRGKSSLVIEEGGEEE
jgi:hypothetical protein